MPKQKTHKGFAKRFKVTASGKVMHRKAGKNHLLSPKSAKRKRTLRKAVRVNKSTERLVRQALASR